MSVLVSGLVWKHAAVKGGTFTVLLAMADISDDDGGEIWPSEVTLASKARMTTRQLRRCIAELEKLGMVECVEKASGRADHYDAYKINVETVVLSNPGGLYGKKRDRKANKTTGQIVPYPRSTGHSRRDQRTFETQPPDIFVAPIDNHPKSVLDPSYAARADAVVTDVARLEWTRMGRKLDRGVFLSHLVWGAPRIEGETMVVEFPTDAMLADAKRHESKAAEFLGRSVRFELKQARKA